jgi:hypothetical protein
MVKHNGCSTELHVHDKKLQGLCGRLQNLPEVGKAQLAPVDGQVKPYAVWLDPAYHENGTSKMIGFYVGPSHDYCSRYKDEHPDRAKGADEIALLRDSLLAFTLGTRGRTYSRVYPELEP